MIFINARFLAQPLTGIQRFASQIILELTAARNDITLLVPTGTAVPESFAHARVVHLGTSGGHRWEQLDLPRFLRKHGNPMLLSLGNTAPAFYRNQIATHHDIGYIKNPESFSRSFRLAYRALAPRFLRRSRAVITVSEFSKHEIAEHYRLDPERITVVHNAVDDRFRPDPSVRSERPYFLAVSSLSAHKNFPRLIEAYLQHAPDTETDLIIIGTRADNFAEQPTAAPGNGRVRFVGRVSDEELIRLYQGAKAFAFPSLYEGFGIPPLEAQQCGTPVIASTAASIPEILGDSALSVDPYDVSAMRDALAQIDTDEELRDQLSEAGAANAAQYSWARSAKRVSDLLDATR